MQSCFLKDFSQVQNWLSSKSPPNISVLLLTGINDWPAHWSHGRRGSITSKEKPALYFSFLHLSLEEPRFHEPPFRRASLYFIGRFVRCVYLCVRACLSELLCFKASARGRKGVCYLCSGPLSAIEGLSGRRKGPLKERREGGNTLSNVACGKLLPMRRYTFAYDPFSSERKTEMQRNPCPLCVGGAFGLL